MIDHLHPDADLAWLASWRGADRGIADIYAGRLQGRLDAGGHRADRAVASALRAWTHAQAARDRETAIREQAARLVATVAASLDRNDPLVAEMDALVASWQGHPDLPLHRLGDQPTVPVQLGQAPCVAGGAA